jgi:cytochrome c peroxidase
MNLQTTSVIWSLALGSLVAFGAAGLSPTRLHAEERSDANVLKLPTEPYQYTPQKNAGHVSDQTLQELDNSPNDNSITNAGAALGRVLFYDKRLSKNDTISCASCHEQKHAFSDPRQFSVGFKGGRTKRNAMSLVNLRFTNLSAGSAGFFWDERAKTLEEQVLMPIQDTVEMGMKLPELEAKLKQLSYYPPLFKAAFDSPNVTGDRVAKAVAQFMRSMVSFDAKFDRAAKAVGNDYSKDFPDFSATENLGKSLFIEGIGGVAEIGCAHCHIPPTFAMPRSFSTGLDLVSRDPGLGARNVPSNDPFTPSNDGKFKASALRNIAQTSPYMHDGRFKTLQQVVDHYSDGVHPHPNLGLETSREQASKKSKTSGFRYTAKQKAALVAFLKTLTDNKIARDPRFSDPFIRPEK